MRRSLPALLSVALAALLACSCSLKADYDIDEVATEEFMGEEEQGGEAGHDGGEHEQGGEETETGMHLHGAGNRNHGTQWFFNQPWAAPFVWGKMLRDTAVLAALSLAVILSSRRRSR